MKKTWTCLNSPVKRWTTAKLLVAHLPFHYVAGPTSLEKPFGTAQVLQLLRVPRKKPDLSYPIDPNI